MAAPTVLYVGTRRGVSVLTSGDGRKWEVESSSLKDWAVTKVVLDPSHPGRAFAGTRGDGVWMRQGSGQEWEKLGYGKLGPGKVRCITIDPHDSDVLYVGTEPVDVWVSRNLGESWTRLESVGRLESEKGPPWAAAVRYPGPGTEPHVRDIAIDATRPGTLYAAVQVGSIIKSVDGGASWKLLENGLDDDVHRIVVNPANPDELFIATGGHITDARIENEGLFKSSDAGESWVALKPAFSRGFIRKYSIAFLVHPAKPDIFYTAVANGSPRMWRKRDSGAESAVIRTRDGGASWEKLTNGIEETQQTFAEALVFDPADPDRLYAGLQNGHLYTSENGGDSWTKLDIEVSSVLDLQCTHAQ